jgi:hypothetical protein
MAKATAKKPDAIYKPVATLCAADRRAVLYSALAKIAPSRSDRDQLFAGGCYKVDVTISGKVGRGQVNEQIVGELCVGEDSERSKSTACDQAELLAYVVAGLTKPERDRLYKTLRDAFRASGAIPSVDVDVLADTKALLTELRSTTTERKRGDVTFKEKKA